MTKTEIHTKQLKKTPLDFTSSDKKLVIMCLKSNTLRL